ncbi:MAG: MFS transporter [Methylobacteriaceae bacterium]|nr:MFS transporter [Methylobacteriaceae bacterium]
MNDTTPTTTAADADVVSPKAWKALWGSAVGYCMDGFDLMILGFMIVAITKDLSLTPQEGSWWVWATTTGAVAGGFLFGSLSDKYGRIKVLTWTILLFAVFTFACGLAQGFWDMLIYRFISGLGLGGEFGIGMALVAEAWPASKRARASSYVGLGWQAGVLAATLAVWFIMPLVGWRGMFMIGVFPAFVAFIIRRTLHEPDIFIEKTKDKPSELAIPLLYADTETTKRSIGMLILCSVQNFGYYGVLIWLPSYLDKALKLGIMGSSTWTAVTIIGMALGIFTFGHVADRIGRRPSFFIWMIMAAVTVVVYSQLSSRGALLVGGAVMGFFINGMLGGYGALMSELYPTQARATAQNVLFNCGRFLGGFGAVVVGYMVNSYGFQTAVALLAVLYIIDLIAMYFLIPEKMGAELE